MLAMRVEIIDQTFFPQKICRADGRINPAPQKAVELYISLREKWLNSHPETLEIPRVVLRPIYVPEEGYEVATEIVIPPLKKALL